MVFNSIFPVFALVGLGILLKQAKLTSEAFLATADRLVYYVFFPLLLFWKIGGASAVVFDWGLLKAAAAAVGIMGVLSLVFIRVFSISPFQAGSFAQSCYRFNTYIGMAIIINALSNEGVRIFGILIGFIIPMINVLAVSTLIWFSGKDYALGQRIRVTAVALISNPLILACVAGVIYARSFHKFPVFMDNFFNLAGAVTLPLALLSIGGSLTARHFKIYLKPALVAAICKFILMPLFGYGLLTYFNVGGLPFQVGMIFFALPTSPAIYVLSSQLHSDTDLASASIVLSTALSIFSLSIVLSLWL